MTTTMTTKQILAQINELLGEILGLVDPNRITYERTPFGIIQKGGDAATKEEYEAEQAAAAEAAAKNKAIMAAKKEEEDKAAIEAEADKPENPNVCRSEEYPTQDPGAGYKWVRTICRGVWARKLIGS